MRPIRFFCVLAAFSLFATANGDIEAVKIIANPDVRLSEISRDDLNRIFLITKTSLRGIGHIEPVLERAGPAHDAFLRDYIGRSDAALMTYYRSLMFTGKASIPRRFRSDPEVAEYVARTKGAIGYVSAAVPTPYVKTLKVK